MRGGHFRTLQEQREVDLIVEHGDGRTVVKNESRHLLWPPVKLNKHMLKGLCVTTGKEAYRRKDGSEMVPAAFAGHRCVIISGLCVILWRLLCEHHWQSPHGILQERYTSA